MRSELEEFVFELLTQSEELVFARAQAGFARSSSLRALQQLQMQLTDFFRLLFKESFPLLLLGIGGLRGLHFLFQQILELVERVAEGGLFAANQLDLVSPCRRPFRLVPL